MTAVGTHYGSQVVAVRDLERAQPPGFLMPQWNSNGTPASPRIYRGLYQAGYAGCRRPGSHTPRCCWAKRRRSATTAQPAPQRIGLLHDVAPLAFLREALCLNSQLQGSRLVRRCPHTATPTTPTPQPAGPHYGPPKRDDVTIGTLSRLSNALDLAARAHAIPRASADLPHRVRRPEQARTSYSGVSRRQAGRIRRDLRKDRLEKPARGGLLAVPAAATTRSAGRPGRASTAAPSASRRASSTSAAAPKPLYCGVADPAGRLQAAAHGFSLWGLVRPATGSTKVTVLVQTQAAPSSYRTLKTVTTEPPRLLDASTRARRAQSWRVRWASPSGVKYEGPAIGATRS